MPRRNTPLKLLHIRCVSKFYIQALDEVTAGLSSTRAEVGSWIRWSPLRHHHPNAFGFEDPCRISFQGSHFISEELKLSVSRPSQSHACQQRLRCYCAKSKARNKFISLINFRFIALLRWPFSIFLFLFNFFGLFFLPRGATRLSGFPPNRFAPTGQVGLPATVSGSFSPSWSPHQIPPTQNPSLIGTGRPWCSGPPGAFSRGPGRRALQLSTSLLCPGRAGNSHSLRGRRVPGVSGPRRPCTGKRPGNSQSLREISINAQYGTFCLF